MSEYLVPIKSDGTLAVIAAGGGYTLAPNTTYLVPFGHAEAAAVSCHMQWDVAIAVDPALHPRILRVLQAQYTGEAGSNGGTQARRPQPQFSAMGSPPAETDMTPAQRRAA